MPEPMGQDEQLQRLVGNFEMMALQVGAGAQVQFVAIARLAAKKLLYTSANRDRFMEELTSQHDFLAEATVTQMSQKAQADSQVIAGLQAKVAELQAPVVESEAIEGEGIKNIDTSPSEADKAEAERDEADVCEAQEQAELDAEDLTP